MKMKVLLAVISLVVSGVVAEAPGAAPYPPSGFRPNGPAFDLPQKQTQNTPQQQYLPALDPRNPQTQNTEYGVPNNEEDDVSVQGIPTQEQLPIFQPSPINGQQYVGPTLQADLKTLDDRYRQQQYQVQQEQYRAYLRQRELEAQANSNGNRQQQPGLFGRTTTSRPETTFTTQRSDDGTTVSSTTESLDLNEGETLEDNSQKKDKVSVEITKQRLQEYPGEFYLSSFAQLQLQPQFAPVQQFGQLRAPLFIQPQGTSQQQIVGYDAKTHFAALPSVLAQRQILEQQAVLQNQQPLFPDPAVRNQQPSYVAPAPVQPLNQYQPFVQPQLQPFPQIQAQPAVVPQAVNQPNYYAQPQPQPNYYAPPQPQPDTEEVDVRNQQTQPQYVYQQSYQPQDFYQQPFPAQSNQLMPNQQTLLLSQAQLVNYPNQDYSNSYSQPQFAAQQQNQPGYQGQDAFLQSGLDVNQQGNGVEQTEEQDENEDGTQDNTATSVATAFGTRTQPRVLTQYGAPFPKAQATPGYQYTTEATAEATTDEGPAVVDARAVATGSRRKSAKLRNRRIRPIFTLDRSGHLVLAEQN